MKRKFLISNIQFPKNILEEEIIATLNYFFFFNYPPTLEEIHTFLKKKTSKRRLTSILEKMEKKSLIKVQKLDVRSEKLEERTTNKKFTSSNLQLPTSNNLSRYTLHQYSNYPRVIPSEVEESSEVTSDVAKRSNLAIQQFNHKPEQVRFTASNFVKRYQISINKLNSRKFRLYIKFLSFFPQIKLVGLSGSVAMLNAGEDHDIDLFIITGKKRLWTGRLIALLLAQILGIRRKRLNNNQQLAINNKQLKNCVCLNLFFDESNLKVLKFKQTEYVAHEVLQMKPLVQKDNIYLRFIDANRWVFDIFPNVRSGSTLISTQIDADSGNPRCHPRISASKRLFDLIEFLLKSFQLYFINKHRSSEIITDSQLWFHPEDFAKKIKT